VQLIAPMPSLLASTLTSGVSRACLLETQICFWEPCGRISRHTSLLLYLRSSRASLRIFGLRLLYIPLRFLLYSASADATFLCQTFAQLQRFSEQRHVFVYLFLLQIFFLYFIFIAYTHFIILFFHFMKSHDGYGIMALQSGELSFFSFALGVLFLFYWIWHG
jgi:hypothetical protein